MKTGFVALWALVGWFGAGAQDVLHPAALTASGPVATSAIAPHADAQGLPPVTSAAERAAQSLQLLARRQQLETAYNQEMMVCYQKFDVTSCRLEARERRLQAHAVLRKDEIAFNTVERRLKAEEAERRLAETNALARDRAQTQHLDAAQTAKALADRAAQKQADHAAQGQQREAYEQKQREAAQRRADLEKKLRERDKPPAASLPARGASQ
jgi:colicin import membrane protein